MMHLSALINGPLITRNRPIRRRMALFLLCRVRSSLNTSCTMNRVNRTCVLYIYIYIYIYDKIIAIFARLVSSRNEFELLSRIVNGN